MVRICSSYWSSGVGVGICKRGEPCHAVEEPNAAELTLGVGGDGDLFNAVQWLRGDMLGEREFGDSCPFKCVH